MTALPPVPSVDCAPALREALADAGYTATGVSSLLAGVAERALARGDPAAARRACTGGSALETLVRLFLLAEPVPAAAAEDALGRKASGTGLIRSGVDGRVRATLDIRPYGDAWYVASDLRPPGGGGALEPDAVVGIGSASLSLVAATPGEPVGSALDLGTGCGVQALHLAGRARAIVATDLSERALAMAALTTALSEVDVELVAGDLFAPVHDRRFDQIVANPPFVIGPNRFTYRDSALPADELTATVIRQAGEHLAPAGAASVLGSWLLPANQDWRDRVRRWLPSSCDAVVVAREFLDPAEHVALWLADGDEDGPATDRVAQDWLAELEQHGAEGVGYGVVLLRRHADSHQKDPEVRFLDLSGEPALPDGDRMLDLLLRLDSLRTADPRALRLQRAPGLRLHRDLLADEDGWKPESVRLSAPGALPGWVETDDALVALVHECDPALPLGAALDLVAAGLGDPGFAARARPAVLALVEAGLLLPR